MLTPEQIAKMIENGKKARATTDIFNPKESPFAMSDADLDKELDKTQILDIEDVDEETLDFLMASTYDTTTKTFKFSYSYANKAHLAIAKKTVESIISYVYNTIPPQAKMDAGQFLAFVLKFYADRQATVVEEDGEPVLFDINFQNRTFGSEPTTELIESLYSFIDEPSDENTQALTAICTKMRDVSVSYAKQQDNAIRQMIADEKK